MKKPAANTEEKLPVRHVPFTISFPGSVKMLRHTALLTFIFEILLSTATYAQELETDFKVPYVPTPPEVVDKMLEVADVEPGDYVIDLGSGDGRIVIEAAKRGAVGHGVEIDPKLVREAEEKAREEGVSNKVSFMEEDVFETDFSRATVVTMYLMTTFNIRLRPSLLENLEPGTRLVSHDFSMGKWKADKHEEVAGNDIYFWVIPAKVEGKWQWKANERNFNMTVKQNFQEIELKVSSGNNSLKVNNAVLSGRRISFTASNPDNGNHYVFHGLVIGPTITGTIQTNDGSQSKVERWSATSLSKIYLE